MNFDHWLAALDERHLQNLTNAEVARALRALSSCYVERRDKLGTGAALEGAGKRAAFALFYGVQHFMIVQRIADALCDRADAPDAHRHVVDLGCGTGTAGAALALTIGAGRIDGFDVNRWAVDEASWTYRVFGLRGRAAVGNLRAARLPPNAFVLAAYAVNELTGDVRRGLLAKILERQRRGGGALIVEPIGRRANPWWSEWVAAVRAVGGREDEWRVREPLPDRQRLLAKASGLDVQELTARSLFLSPVARGA